MSLSIVVDMSLSPEWVLFLTKAGWSAVHWATVGNPRAPDADIMAWAAANRNVVFTHDLDFGTILALTHAVGPSVIQVRSQRILPEHVGAIVLAALNQYQGELAAGAIVVVEPSKTRARVLPL